MLDTNNKLTILVTGGCGFIGSEFLRTNVKKYPQHLFLNLDALTYAGDLKKVESISKQENYTFIHGNICDSSLINEIFSKYSIDIVVNFAAESHVDNSIENPNIFIETNVVGTQVLLEAARKFNVSRYHQISTDEVYGDLPLDKPELLFTEQTPISPSSPYSASKASADLLCMAYHRTYNMPITISRCSNNYGEYQDNEKFIPTIIRKLENGEKVPVYGTGQNVRDWIYVGDHNLGVITILNKGIAGQIYNLGSSNEYSNINLVKLAIKLMDKSENSIIYVEDRKGHDQRYAIDYTHTYNRIGWKSNYNSENFNDKFAEVIKWYIADLKSNSLN